MLEGKTYESILGCNALFTVHQGDCSIGVEAANNAGVEGAASENSGAEFEAHLDGCGW